MFIEQLEAVAHCILAQCERARCDSPESIDDDTILKVLNDFSCETITITPEPRHGNHECPTSGWKATIGAVIELFNLFNLAATCPTTTAPTTTTSTTTPTSNVSTATASTVVAPTTTTPTATTPATTTPVTTPVATVDKKTRSRKTKDIVVSKVISQNLTAWRDSPRKLFDQDLILLEDFLCDYIKNVSDSDIPSTLRLRFSKRMLARQRQAWSRNGIASFLQHLEDRGLIVDRGTFGRWILEGKTYELFVQTWGPGSLLTTDLTASQAEKFPHRDNESRMSRLAGEECRGIKELAATYNTTGTALWEYFSQISFADNFVSDDTTSLMTARKRRSSQTLTHRNCRPFRIDKTVAEFALQPELVSSPVTTRIGDVAEREAARTDEFVTRSAGGRKGSRSEVENSQRSSPTAPAHFQSVAEPSPRSASSTIDRGFTEDGFQRPLNCGTDRSAYSDHRNDRIDVQSPNTHQRVFGVQGDGHSRHLSPSPSHSQQLPVEMSEDSLRNASLISGTDVATSQVLSLSHDHQLSHGTRDVPQHPQVSGDVSSHSPTTHAVPTTAAIQSRIAERPTSNPRPESGSHDSVQEPSASPQYDRRLELTHQPKLPSLEPREEAKTNDDCLGSAQQPSTQDLSPVQPHGLEPIFAATETSCHPQHGNPPPHSPQTVPDPTVIQRHGTGGAFSQFQERNPPEFLERQDSLQGQHASTVGSPPPVHQQLYHPEHPGVTGYLDQLVDSNEPSVTPAMLDQPYDVNQEPSQADLDWNILTWDWITSLEDVSTDHLLFSGLNELEGIL
ncbi:hypothetical protein AK830_g12422 [Neonectria ditissima]|uniref:Uncharacterized protein n=1 Tax=Neonectria ditissima TaxID=78410 RepID=A0A0P7AAR9_9HYPO|nr:hypothetical protein AK830_g12422 [Neonectria ditissima]